MLSNLYNDYHFNNNYGVTWADKPNEYRTPAHSAYFNGLVHHI